MALEGDLQNIQLADIFQSLQSNRQVGTLIVSSRDREKRFAFDIELLLRTVLGRPSSIARVPIAWIDSEAASTTKELQPYLTMLQSIVRISTRYLPRNDEAQSFAALIDSLDEASWTRLSENVPSQIANREPIEFDEYQGVSADDLSRVAHSGRSSA